VNPRIVDSPRWMSIVVTMSEAGWNAFLTAEGLGDWVVLHGGPTAVFRTRSLAEAARLATAIADLQGIGPRTILTVAQDHLTVKLTREVWATESGDIDIARAVSAVAHERGAVGDRSAAQEVQLAIAAKPDAIDLPFWRAVLGYSPIADDNGIDPLGQGSTVWMQDLDPAKPLNHAMHIDVSLAKEQITTRLDEAIAAGGRIVDDSDAPSVWILADRSGNKVCLVAWPDGATATLAT
jgi:4a-hydroxytetrahydrobiopterin dehydratase